MFRLRKIHFILISFVCWTALLAGCSERADEDTCQRACDNNARIFATQATDGDSALAESLLESASGDMSACQASCGEQSQQYAECLASATAQKQLRECLVHVDK